MQKKICLLLVVLAVASAQEFTNAYCESFDDQENCLKCASRYYLDSASGICFPVSPLCNTYSHSTGMCTSCYSGFGLTPSGNCITIASPVPNCGIYSNLGFCLQCKTDYTASADGKSCIKIINTVINVPNCVQYEQGVCIKCEFDYFLTNTRICVRMSPLCLQYEIDGKCSGCISGFVLDQGKCKLQSQLLLPEFDPLCARFENMQCVKCSWGTFKNSQGRCQQANPLCKTFDPTNGECLSCYPGFQVQEGNCVILKIQLDPNCNKFQGTKCVRCSQGAYFDENGKCQIKDTNCKQVSATGECIACYPGYSINQDGVCNVNKNFNCYEWSNGRCKKCSVGFYLESDGTCEMINPLCKIFDSDAKICRGCYSGYILDNGQCYEYSKYTGQVPYDPYCSEYDLTRNCLSCYNRYFLKQGVCQQVSPYCKTYEKNQGYCLSCYRGYRMNEFAECVINA